MARSPFDRSRDRVPGLALGGHGVEFYADDSQIVEKVARFVAPALDGTGVALVIATQKHRGALDGALFARGIDAKVAAREGRYVALDAATTLSKFLIDGKPDAERFVDVIGGVISRAQAGSYPGEVRTYGEMVALLWLAGRPDAAIALEKMWNDLARSLSFTLLCGYPVGAFEPSQAERIAEVGRLHSQVGPFQAVPSVIPA